MTRTELAFDAFGLACLILIWGAWWVVLPS